MRTFLRTVVVWYFYFGLALGFIVWASYMWGLNSAVSSEVPLNDRVRVALDMQPTVAYKACTRIFVWGPSLAIWAATPKDYSFGEWLAPGFYARRLSKGG